MTVSQQEFSEKVCKFWTSVRQNSREKFAIDLKLSGSLRRKRSSPFPAESPYGSLPPWNLRKCLVMNESDHQSIQISICQLAMTLQGLVRSLSHHLLCVDLY